MMPRILCPRCAPNRRGIAGTRVRGGRHGGGLRQPRRGSRVQMGIKQKKEHLKFKTPEKKKDTSVLYFKPVQTSKMNKVLQSKSGGRAGVLRGQACPCHRSGRATNPVDVHVTKGELAGYAVHFHV